MITSTRFGVLPATACGSASTTNSPVQVGGAANGVRLYVTVAGASTAGNNDTLYLCLFQPGVPATPIPLVGFAAASMLSVNGTYVADFYPGAWLPPTVAAAGKLLGAAGIRLPAQWSVQIVMGTTSVATVTVDAETLP